MGEQSIHNNEVKQPATLTITPVRAGNGDPPGGPGGSGNGGQTQVIHRGGGQVIHMVEHSRASTAATIAATSNATRLRSSRDQHHPQAEQPDTTESLD